MKTKVIWGCPCSGKSTYVEENIGSRDLVYDYDRLIRAMTYRDHHVAEKSHAHDIAISYRLSFINKLLGGVDADTAWILTRYPTNSLRTLLEPLEPEYIKMDVSQEECLSRLMADPTRPDKEAWEEVIKDWFSRYGGEELERTSRREMRTIPQAFETREENGALYIEGYFAVFGSDYELWPGAVECIRQGAFDGVLDGDVRALTNHDTTLVLGRTTAGTLELRQDNHGLWGRVRVNQADTDAMNLYSRIQRGDVDQCSFGFDIGEEETSEGPEGIRWTITKISKLYEVSVCTFPAYESTGVVARRRDLEDIQERKSKLWRAEMRGRLKGDKSGT